MFKNIMGEFKKFALRGNVMDMAVGIILGGAIGKVVDSLVKDMIMPPVGMLLGKVDFANLFFTLHDGKIAGPYASLDAATKAGAVTLNLGNFLNTIISFTIIAFAVFLLVKAMNSFRDQMDSTEEAAPETKDCPFCFTSISIKATRCPNCTSELPTVKAVAAPAPVVKKEAAHKKLLKKVMLKK